MINNNFQLLFNILSDHDSSDTYTEILFYLCVNTGIGLKAGATYAGVTVILVEDCTHAVLLNQLQNLCNPTTFKFCNSISVCFS